MISNIGDLQHGTKSFYTAIRHRLIEIIAGTDLIMLNAKLTPQKDTGEYYLSVKNIDEGFIVRCSFGVENGFIVMIEQNK